MSRGPDEHERAEAPRQPAVPGVVWGSALGLSALALTFVSRLPDFPVVFALAFVFVALVRLIAGRAGHGLVPWKAVRALQVAGIASAAAWIFHLLGTGPALLGLLVVCVAVQAFLFIPRQTAFVVFLQVLFSSTTAVGTAFLAKESPALAFAVAYVLALAWTLLLYERGAALSEAESTQGAVRKLRASSDAPLPVRPLLGTVVRFVALGFPLGLLLYLGVPRTWDWLDPTSSEDVERRRNERDPTGGGTTPGSRIMATSGPPLLESGTSVSVEFGTVAMIKRDFTPWFEVRELANPAPPERVILRDSALDLFQKNGRWASSDRSQRAYTSRKGVIEMGGADDEERGRTLEIRVLQPGRQRLFLEPNGVSFRIRRQERTLRRFVVGRRGDEVWQLVGRNAFRYGDLVVQRSVPQWRPGMELTGLRSDSDVSPRLTYLEVPKRFAARLRTLALKVVQDERDPWMRAQLLEAWLRSDEFEYALNPPPVDRRQPIMDFLTRTRSGHCEMYAGAITLMLRTLGHPARWARGFWGGAPSKDRGSVVMRKSDYHAWCEMYLDGPGWIPLNPTPPDRRPVDADTQTVEATAGLDPEDTSSIDFLGLNSQNWSRFWQAIGDWIHDYILQPLGSLFARAPLLFGALLFGLLAWALRRRMTRVPTEPSRAARKRAIELGAYGEALRLLAREGTRRRRAQTLREFESFAARRHPEIARDFGVLTGLREQERFAGRSGAELQTRAQQAFVRLRALLSAP